MIQASKVEWIKHAFFWLESRFIFPHRFNKIRINEVEIKPDHSVLLLQNHFSWWDGFFGSYLAYKVLNKNYHVMVQEDQLKKRKYLRYRGAFSIRKNSRDILDALGYAAELLGKPENMVLIFPQGKLQSMHAREIKFEKGVSRIIGSIDGKCQVIYCAAVVDYLESFKPSVTFHLLDCGSTKHLNLDQLEKRISAFHKESLKSTVRK